VVAGDGRRSKRHVRGGGTRQECKQRGGDKAYDITHNASWIDTAGGATHRCEAKATAATEGRRGGMRRRGRDQMIVRRSVGRDRAARRQGSVCQRQTLSISRRHGAVVTWLRREKRGRRFPESPRSSFYKVAANAQRITEGLASNRGVAVSAAGSARPMARYAVDPMAVRPTKQQVGTSRTVRGLHPLNSTRNVLDRCSTR
jgi:hypothetical protein